MRVAPNASHYGISQFIENSLIPVINRWQQDCPCRQFQCARIRTFRHTPSSCNSLKHRSKSLNGQQ
nr:MULTISPECIES: hypothetical protein [unclassified Pseudomonas]